MIEFIENGHVYLKDGIIIPSVSEIISYIFPNKYNGIPKNILEKKAKYGEKVHLAIQLLEETGKLIKLNPNQRASISQYLQIKDYYNIEVLEQEKIVSYKMEYAGRLDMVAKVDGKLCLIDIKTTYELDEEYLSWQLSYYELAYGIKFDKLYCLWLPKNQLGDLIEIKRKEKKELLEKIKEKKENEI